MKNKSKNLKDAEKLINELIKDIRDDYVNWFDVSDNLRERTTKKLIKIRRIIKRRLKK